MINISGHKVSTVSMEEALKVHKDVKEAAVVGIHDSVKGGIWSLYIKKLAFYMGDNFNNLLFMWNEIFN